MNIGRRICAGVAKQRMHVGLHQPGALINRRQLPQFPICVLKSREFSRIKRANGFAQYDWSLIAARNERCAATGRRRTRWRILGMAADTRQYSATGEQSSSGKAYGTLQKPSTVKPGRLP